MVHASWKKLSIFTLVFASASLALATEERLSDFEPWFTGPIVAPSGNNLPLGQGNIEPYLNVEVDYGAYQNSWKREHIKHVIEVYPLMFLQAGLCSWLDMTLIFQDTYAHQGSDNVNRFNDLVLSFGIQLLKDKPGTAIPSLRLNLTEQFPVGKYENLNTGKLAIDAGGAGTYRTGIGLNLSKVVYWMKSHPISWRCYVKATIPTHVPVHEFHAYGGGFGTDGTIKPYFGIIQGTSMEISITQRWAFAFEYLYEFKTSSTFSGTPGSISKTILHEDDESQRILFGPVTQNGTRVSHRISLAPAIEYSFNADLGIIAGVWFTVCGKNATAMATGVFAVTYTW